MDTYFILAHRVRRRRLLFWLWWCDSFILSKTTTFDDAQGIIREFRRDHPKFDFYWCGLARPTHCGCGRPL